MYLIYAFVSYDKHRSGDNCYKVLLIIKTHSTITKVGLMNIKFTHQLPQKIPSLTTTALKNKTS